MPLTTQESIGLGVGILNVWHEHVNAHTLRQMNMTVNQYVDDRVVAYIIKESEELSIRITNLEDYKKRSNIITDLDSEMDNR